MKRVRFYISKEACKGDYRPVMWPIKHPYWCTGENSTHFILIAYVGSMEELTELWPEAEVDVVKEVSRYEFTSRFPKPDWYKKKEE